MTLSNGCYVTATRNVPKKLFIHIKNGEQGFDKAKKFRNGDETTQPMAGLFF